MRTAAAVDGKDGDGAAAAGAGAAIDGERQLGRVAKGVGLRDGLQLVLGHKGAGQLLIQQRRVREHKLIVLRLCRTQQPVPQHL